MNTNVRRIPLVLPVPDYEALEALAEREDRSPMQQAAHIVRRALASTSPTSIPKATIPQSEEDITDAA